MSSTNRMALPKLSIGSTLTFLLLVIVSCANVNGALPQANNLIIYDNSLAPGWEDWSWDSTINFDATNQTHSASKAIAITHTVGNGGFSIRNGSPIDTSGYKSLDFWIYGNGEPLTIYTQSTDNGGEGTAFNLTPTDGQWKEVSIPLTTLGSPGQIARINWQSASDNPEKVYYLDDIQLIGSETPPPPPANGLTLSVDAGADRKPISPDIYGMNEYETNGNVATFLKELRLPVRRWGGNIATRYNWKNDIGNHASDWYFNNLQESDSTNPPDDSAVNRFIEQNRAAKADSLVTLPLIGYVSNDKPEACGFSVKKYGAQEDTAAADGRPDCGNGVRPDHKTLVTGNDPLDTSIKIDQNFIADWVKYLVKRYGSAQNGGVRFYNLDNEPDIWFETHRDVWPIGYKYDQFRDLTYTYGAAIKAADPSAALLGPVVDGWTYYFHSSYDGQRDDYITPDDRDAHGGTPFIPWYLQQMKAYEQAHGVRILDYLDVHYYPASDEVSLSPAGDAAKQALRLRSTRSLWDPSYQDESWIAGAGPDGGIIQLIPRLKQWVKDNYPGTKTAITEYNWGGMESINGALAQADVLGIFGREGLDLATLWQPPDLDQPGAFAFRIYRNYDGKAGEFGDTGISAISSDLGKLSIYAAQRSGDKALTIVIINKSTTGQSAPLTLDHFSAGTAQLYRYSSANLKAIVREADVTFTSNKLIATYPANSITLLVIPQAGENPPPPPQQFDTKLFLPYARR